VRGKQGNGKRTFKDLRTFILICLSSGQHTINEISFKTKINWKTVELHLTYLVGRRLVNEVVSSKYVRIFELSEDGKTYIRSLGIEPTEKNNQKEEIKL
jgi:predicted transcriptional regulator